MRSADARLEAAYGRVRYVLILFAAVPLMVAAIVAAMTARTPGRPQLHRTWIFLVCVGAAFLLTWATSRRMPVRSFLTAWAIFVVAIIVAYFGRERPSSSGPGPLYYFLWLMLLYGTPLWAGVLLAVRLHRARERRHRGIPEAREDDSEARRLLLNAGVGICTAAFLAVSRVRSIDPRLVNAAMVAAWLGATACVTLLALGPRGEETVE